VAMLLNIYMVTVKPCLNYLPLVRIMEVEMQNFKVKKLQWRETEKGYISECGKYFIMKTDAGKYFPMKNDKKAISDIFFFTENTSNFFTLKEDAMRSAQKHLDAYVKKNA